MSIGILVVIRMRCGKAFERRGAKPIETKSTSHHLQEPNDNCKAKYFQGSAVICSNGVLKSFDQAASKSRVAAKAADRPFFRPCLSNSSLPAASSTSRK